MCTGLRLGELAVCSTINLFGTAELFVHGGYFFYYLLCPHCCIVLFAGLFVSFILRNIASQDFIGMPGAMLHELPDIYLQITPSHGTIELADRLGMHRYA